ncbi:methyltransferase domain-containing protein [Pseudaminobacter sp. 19-2017]|uniref:Methyltransferase domain-containing protein n=1 Tax=Pseudaminobacter soli (ex Zhang et al. 2022) TaxID=2831468 RepID=A0A942DXT2_9HYPH|nr:methyltransferase domain-containing protein [Pseudaminobacter soli]MBS3647321.1 methyltransferase domain-containing protein [Pseudaminobacter soli]
MLTKDQSARSAAHSGHGINFPRLYDLIVKLLARGRESTYRKDVLDLAGIVPGDHVLDIGCGTGTQAIAAWGRTQPGGSVTGLDISPSMIEAAQRKSGRAGVPLSLCEGSATELSFESGRFDVVTITTVLHMVDEARRRVCLLEARRVLRGGGRLLIVDYGGNPQHRRLSARLGLHGHFDLHDLREPMGEEGFIEITGGRLSWLDLHFLKGTKA